MKIIGLIVMLGLLIVGVGVGSADKQTEEIWLVTGFDENARATHLYRKLGWTFAGTQDNQRLLTLKRTQEV